MERREYLMREINDLQNKIASLERDVKDCEADIQEYEKQIGVYKNQFMDEFYGTENSFINDTAWGSDSDVICRECNDRQHEHRQTEIQFNEESRASQNNLRDAKNRLRRKEALLQEAKNNLHFYQNELQKLPQSTQEEVVSYKQDKEDYNPYHNGYNAYEQDYYDEPAYDYEPTVNIPHPRKHSTPNRDKPTRPSVKRYEIDKVYTSHRKGLENYAKISKQNYTELDNEQGGYKASVGNTIFDYKNPDDLVITSKKGEPSIDDFKTIFKIEKENGRTSIPIANMENKEYQARLVTGALEAGLNLSGDFRLKANELEQLTPETKKRYTQTLQAQDNDMAKRREALRRALRGK